MKTLNELQQDYDLELDRVAKEIQKQKPKKVLLQFPDGLKPYSTQVVDLLQKKFPKILFTIWLGSCFGACDIPSSDADLIIQFGHAKWK